MCKKQKGGAKAKDAIDKICSKNFDCYGYSLVKKKGKECNKKHFGEIEEYPKAGLDGTHDMIVDKEGHTVFAKSTSIKHTYIKTY